MKTKQIFKMLVLVPAALFLLSSCHDSDHDKGYSINMVNGLLIVNEGSFYSQVNGSADYLNFLDGTLERNVFDKVNLRTLGGTPNSAVACGGKILIATTDENRIEIVNARTLVAEEGLTVTKPRELATDGQFVYVSSYNGKVLKINPLTSQVVATSETIGTNLEGIAVRGGYVYVCNAWNSDYTYNTNVVKLNAGNLSKVADITVVANPNVLVSDGTNLYLASWGNYYDVPATVQKIDASDQITTIGTAQHLAYTGGYLYMVYAPWGGTPVYQRYNTASGTTETLALGSEVFSPVSIAANPSNGDIYVGSLSENPDAPGSASYDIDGFLVKYDRQGQFKKKYDVGVNPGTLFVIGN